MHNITVAIAEIRYKSQARFQSLNSLETLKT